MRPRTGHDWGFDASFAGLTRCYHRLVIKYHNHPYCVSVSLQFYCAGSKGAEEITTVEEDKTCAYIVKVSFQLLAQPLTLALDLNRHLESNAPPNL